MVRETGLEPVCQRHTPLKRACLPIPPLSQFRTIYIIQLPSVYVKGFFKKISNFFQKNKNTPCKIQIYVIYYNTSENRNCGVWLSLVERLVRDQEAAGSSPVTPTNKNADFMRGFAQSAIFVFAKFGYF